MGCGLVGVGWLVPGQQLTSFDGGTSQRNRDINLDNAYT